MHSVAAGELLNENLPLPVLSIDDRIRLVTHSVLGGAEDGP